MSDVLSLFGAPRERPDRDPLPAGHSAGVVRYAGRTHHRDRGCTNPEGPNEFGRCCHRCDWGAFVCAVCGGAEGEVPRDCPGRPMTEAERDAVLGGRLEYVNAAGGWVDGGYDLGRVRR